MNSGVLLKVRQLLEWFVAVLAVVLPLAGVHERVLVELGGTAERLIAVHAGVGLILKTVSFFSMVVDCGFAVEFLGKKREKGHCQWVCSLRCEVYDMNIQYLTHKSVCVRDFSVFCEQVASSEAGVREAPRLSSIKAWKYISHEKNWTSRDMGLHLEHPFVYYRFFSIRVMGEAATGTWSSIHNRNCISNNSFPGYSHCIWFSWR